MSSCNVRTDEAASSAGMPITYQSEDIPDLWTFDLPQDERDQAQELQSRLQDMAGITEEAAAAVALFEFARQRRRDLEDLLATHPADRLASPQKHEQELVAGWQLIAARCLVSAVWRLEELRTLATALAGAVPAIAALIDRKAMKHSSQLFSGHFQQAGVLQRELAQGAARERPARTARRVGPWACDASGPFEESIVGACIGYTRQGQLLTLEISQQTLKNLVEVRDRFFAAFATVGETLQEKHWQESRGHAARQIED